MKSRVRIIHPKETRARKFEKKMIKILRPTAKRPATKLVPKSLKYQTERTTKMSEKKDKRITALELKLKTQGYNHPKIRRSNDGKARTKKIKETSRTRKDTINRATRTKDSTTVTGTHPNNTETTTTITTTTTLTTIALTITHTTRTEDHEVDKETEKVTVADDPPSYDPNKINNPPPNNIIINLNNIPSITCSSD